MIRVQCPRCLRKYRVPEQHVGAMVNCRAAGCSQVFQVPPGDPEILEPAVPAAMCLPPLPQPAEPEFGSSDVVVSRGVIPASLVATNPGDETRNGSWMMLAGVGMVLLAAYLLMLFRYDRTSTIDITFGVILMASAPVFLWGLVSWAIDDRSTAKPLFPSLTGPSLLVLALIFFVLSIIEMKLPLDQMQGQFDEQGNTSAVEWIKFAKEHRDPLGCVFLLLSPTCLVWGTVRWLGMRGRLTPDDLAHVK